MSVKVSLQQAQNDLSQLLEKVATTGEEFVVQRDGKDCAVIISAKQWRRRRAAQRLDGLSVGHRLSGTQQARAESLLTAKKQRRLTPTESSELKALLMECDAVMLQRAAALEAVL